MRIGLGTSAGGGHDMRQGGKGPALLHSPRRALGHSLSLGLLMLDGGKAKRRPPDGRGPPHARLPVTSAALPCLPLLRRRLRHQGEPIDKSPARTPAVELAAQGLASIVLRFRALGSFGAVIAGREPSSSGRPNAPVRPRLEVGPAADPANGRRRGVRRKDRAPMIPRRREAPSRPRTFPAPLSSGAPTRPSHAV